MTHLAGIDIGGTKIAVCLGKPKEDSTGIEIVGKKQFPTPATAESAIRSLTEALDELLQPYGHAAPDAIGISCGGPLDSKAGLILSPPNLPGWDRIPIVSAFRKIYGVPVQLQNDANACALAEWRWGAGRGCQNMVFLTFGTGMGAGLILDGRLYAGTNDMAGEVGHMRMEADGPIGYGKAGSFEGFCSGAGIALLARTMASKALAAGNPPAFCPSEADLSGITALAVAEAARSGNALALEVFTVVGKQLGRGLAVLVDLLNPERIVIGSIYARQQSLLEPIVRDTLGREALRPSLSVCRVVPAGLGEQIGDYASLSVAWQALN